MKRLEVRLSLQVVAPLVEALKSVADSLEGNLAAPLELGEVDPDLRDFWREELVEGQNGEIGILIALFGESFSETGVIVLDDDNAEAVIRACAAVRLRLRAVHLMSISDEMLETGDMRVDEVPEGMKHFFMCYLFLATLQDLVIQHMDDSCDSN